MTVLTIGTLKKIIEKVPESYSVEYDQEVTIVPIKDKIEIDISRERIIFK